MRTSPVNEGERVELGRLIPPKLQYLILLFPSFSSSSSSLLSQPSLPFPILTCFLLCQKLQNHQIPPLSFVATSVVARSFLLPSLLTQTRIVLASGLHSLLFSRSDASIALIPISVLERLLHSFLQPSGFSSEDF